MVLPTNRFPHSIKKTPCRNCSRQDQGRVVSDPAQNISLRITSRQWRVSSALSKDIYTLGRAKTPTGVSSAESVGKRLGTTMPDLHGVLWSHDGWT